MIRLATLCALGALALTGCSTLGGIREDAPRASYESARSPLALEPCLTAATGAFNVIRGEGVTEIVLDDRGTVLIHITLRPVAARTAVEVRTRFQAYKGRLRRKVEACVLGTAP